jgi:4-azaleucine resistance transporter AzlC
MSAPLPTRRSECFAGLRAILPLLIGSIPFAIIFGAVAVTGGLSPGAAAAMSAFVFAGSAQFVAAGMVTAGAGVGLIILTTLIVNLRHMLYAITLAPYMRRLSQAWLLPLGFTLTDEAFMVTIRRYQTPDDSPYKHWFFAAAAAALYVNWQMWTYVGIWAGQEIPNPQRWGLDFAFPVTFLGMLLPQLTNASFAACALSAAVTALLLRGLPNQLGLIVAALVGVTCGMAVEQFARRRRPAHPESSRP